MVHLDSSVPCAVVMSLGLFLRMSGHSNIQLMGEPYYDSAPSHLGRLDVDLCCGRSCLVHCLARHGEPEQFHSLWGDQRYFRLFPSQND